MKLVDKHLLKEFAAPITYCLLTFTMVILIADLFDDMNKIVETKPPAHLVLRYYLAALGPGIQFLMPASLMLATLYTLYSLTRNNELTAMRASGISIYRIMFPFLLVGVVFSIATAVAQEMIIPKAIEWAQELKTNNFVPVTRRLCEDAFYYNSAEYRQWHIEKFDMKAPSILHGVEIKQETPSGMRDFIITADKAEYLDGQWWLTNVRKQSFTNDNPMGKAKLLRATEESVVEMRQFRFSEEPTAFANAARQWDFLSTGEMREFLRTHPRLSSGEVARIAYQIHSRSAMPWACFIVMLFAIPAGARTGRQGALAAVFTAIGLMAAFYVVYWLGQILGSTRLIYPWVGAWLSNMVFVAVGLYMLSRIR